MNIGKTGTVGEDRVVSFLKKNGCDIIKRNFSCRFGEIDIIAETKEYIIFVEVKTRKKESMVSGVQAVDFYKQKRIISTAKYFLSKFETDKNLRFDVAEVTVSQKEDGGLGYNLNYIKNAF